MTQHIARFMRMMAALILLPIVTSVAHAQVEVDLPLGVGLHVPSYDRVNGLSLPFGPTIIFGDERFLLDPLITYRSHLGNIDPSLAATFHFDSLFSLSVQGERGTFTNDGWIHSDLMNSLWALGFGRDARNYFRADRAHAYFNVHLQTESVKADLFVGPQFENAWSTGWRAGEDHRGPFSLIGHHDDKNGMDRPNPLIDQGHIASAIVGGSATYKSERLLSHAQVLYEAAWHTPLSGKFQQLTFNEEGFLPTLWGQGLQVDFHLVTTTGDQTPLQRYVYLGGSGTLETVDLLTLGGDRMYFLDSWYRIPLHLFEVPLVGHPYVAPRFVTGAAGVREFGLPTQNIGLRVGLGPLHLDYLVNPRNHKDVISGGFSVPR